MLMKNNNIYKTDGTFLILVCFNGMSQKIFKAYKDYVLSENKRPTSVFAFCKEHKLKENDFYQLYNSFETLEAAFVKSLFDDIVSALKTDKAFEAYNAREKLLALFYAWTEKALNERSFMVYLAAQESMPIKTGIEPVRMAFNEFVKTIIAEAINTNEIIERKFISDKYYHAMWTQFLLVHQYWLKDKSKGFEKTDAFIEKSTHLVFDLLGQSALDSALDLAKFMFQKA